MFENNNFENENTENIQGEFAEDAVNETAEEAAASEATESADNPEFNTANEPAADKPPMYNWVRDDYTPKSTPVFTEHRKSSGKKGLIAVALVCTVLLSAFLGFAGGFFASRIFNNRNDVQVPTTNITSEQLAAADSSSFNAAAVAAVGLESVVEITTEVVSRSTFMGDYVTNGAGSGVIIKEDGYIVTNHHVIEGASKITVRTRNGKEYPATIVGYDAKTDLAVIKIEVSGLVPAAYGTSADLVVGQPVLAIGNPLGELGGTVTEGIVSALDREVQVEKQVMRLLQTDASVNPGNSGGGLFDGKGRLVGVINAKSSGSGIEGLGFAIPIDTAKTVIDELIANGYVTGRAEAGIEVTYIDERTAYLYRLGDEGVYISAVTRGSAAEAAGLLSGDRIEEIDGKEIDTPQEAVDVIQEHKAGDTVDFKIERQDKDMVVKVTLDEQKPSLASLF
ncbi:MAG: trypsin-like peptidase domain-containing protein [Clostridia bacterium]|nr:trypsin-like peptidase domain-containing protein [Clostridia bacterium]